MRRKMLLSLLVVLLAASLVATGCPRPVVVDEEPEVGVLEKPQIISVGSLGVGSRGYVVASGLALGVEKTQGIRTLVEPIPSMASRMAAIRALEIDIALASPIIMIWAARGEGAEPYITWGPQPVRQVMHGYMIHMSWMTRPDTGVTTWEEFAAKGLRVPRIPGDFVIDSLMVGFIAAYDLEGRVREVPFPSLPATWVGLQEGTVDVAVMGPGTGLVAEIQALVGLQFMEQPDKGDPKWEIIRKYHPFAALVPYTWDTPAVWDLKAAGMPEEGIWTIPFVNPKAAWEDADEAKVYYFVRGVIEGYDHFKDIHFTLRDEYTVEKILPHPDVLTPVPFHSGAVRAFKDLGVWRPEHEAFQVRMLEEERIRLGR
ncbi:MAG: hypothetical protein DDT30_01428 [Dehalococcoidia bacterium]|nr:hypothetical protein [Bacillota bacterium]MBT9142932.1 hypothetical protein [Bacillota bacterium]